MAQTEHHPNSRAALDCTFTLGDSVCEDFISGYNYVKTEARLLCIWQRSGSEAALHTFRRTHAAQQTTCGRIIYQFVLTRK